ncbi:MAG TPA: hypothetical protein VJJ82_05965 [Candidatus Nanoarchaeia archaeon]|nr:hypothetical protein [Candidatus Nanoarchaeia archaeon]
MKTIISVILIAAFIISCAPVLPANSANKSSESPDQVVINISNNTGVNQTASANLTINSTTPKNQTTPAVNKSSAFTPRKEIVEGELVNFPSLRAVDPDGDPITYTFSKPLSEKGEWRTSVGDAGEYPITITASDGVNTVSQQVLIVVKARNKAPSIALNEPLFTAEGQTFTLQLNVSDADGDRVTVNYSGFMSSESKLVGYNESGLRKVVISASDGKSVTTREVLVSVNNTNRPPTFASLAAIKVKEGEKVTVKPSATDPDGDKVTFTFDSPLGVDGSWTTAVGDAGNYSLNVIASDGELTAEQKVTITISAVNRPPVIELDSPINVKEGETVHLTPTITDKENDEVKVTYAGWMTSDTKQTNFNDQGSHKVVVSARDSAGNQATLDVTVNVADVNRPPVFGSESFG